MEQPKKVYVHYEGMPEYTHLAKITPSLTVEQLAAEFARVYNAKHGRVVSLDSAMIHLVNGKLRMKKSANVNRLVQDRSDIFVELGTPIAAGSAHPFEQNLSAKHEGPQGVSPPAETVTGREVGSGNSETITKGESPPGNKELVYGNLKTGRKSEGSSGNMETITKEELDSGAKREQASGTLKAGTKTEGSGNMDQLQEAAFDADLASAIKRVPEGGRELQVPFIRAVLERALKAQELKKYNIAGQIFSKVLELLPKQRICLRGLGSMALALGHFSEALPWLQRGAEAYPKDTFFQTRLGDVYTSLGNYQEALREYDCALGLAVEQNLTVDSQSQQNPLERLLVDNPAAGDILGAVTIDGLKISAAVVFGKMGQGDLANAILTEVLTQNSENLDALYEYGTLLLNLGMAKEALQVFLKILISNQGKENVRASLAKAIRAPQGIDMLRTEVAVDPAATSVIAFLASCAKDYGGLEEALELFSLAIKLSPMELEYWLSLIHLYEVKSDYLKALDLALSLFGKFPSYSLSKLQFGDVVPHLEGLNWTESSDNGSQQSQYQVLKVLARAEWFRGFDELPGQNQADMTYVGSDQRNGFEGNCNYSEGQLDGLAVLFTVTKILFFGGALKRAKLLAMLIEPARIASSKPLHQTKIRNEAAYFSSVQQILEQYQIPLPLPPLREQDPLYLAGDSHCMSAAWRTVQLRDQNRLLLPMLVTGLKVWHLRPESEFYPKYAFQNLMESVADGSQLVMVIGEIDCREGILTSVEKGIYKSMEHGVEVVVNLYLEVLQQLISSRGFELFVHPVPPVLNETRAVVLFFNRILKGKLEGFKKKNLSAGKRLHWLDFVIDLLTAEGLLKEEFKLDGTHLSPKYCSLLQQELSKVK